MQTQGCDQEISALPILSSCPPDAAYIFLVGVPELISPSNLGGYALISYANLKSCFVCDVFGVGTVYFNGTELGAGNIYLNANLSSNLDVFYNGGKALPLFF